MHPAHLTSVDPIDLVKVHYRISSTEQRFHTEIETNNTTHDTTLRNAISIDTNNNTGQMKFFLLKLTALALVATSSVHASGTFVLRGSLDNEDVMVEVEASCSEGTKDGQKSVKKLWKNSGNDCDNSWDLEKRANRMTDRKYPSNSRNWRTKAYNKCARDGAEEQVQKIEKTCLNDDSGQCVGLGETAAEIIVFDNVCRPEFDQASSSHSPPDYKKTCRQVAYGICKGQISTKINEYCSDKRMSSTKLLRLQDKCKRQIDSMVRDDGLEFMA